MSAVIAFFLSTAGKYAALGTVVLAALSVAWRAAFKAGKDSEQAKIGRENANTIDKLAKANAARANADTDSVSDDGFKRH